MFCLALRIFFFFPLFLKNYTTATSAAQAAAAVSTLVNVPSSEASVNTSTASASWLATSKNVAPAAADDSCKSMFLALEWSAKATRCLNVNVPSAALTEKTAIDWCTRQM